MSLGLSMITNDSNAAISFINKYGQYFDKFFITVADKDKKAYSHLSTFATDEPKLSVSYFKWRDDFAAARNYNLEQIDTDFWFWADDDDEIVDAHHLIDIVRLMAKNNLDVVQLKYDYAQDESGNAISDHWRERIVRRAYEGKWDAPVHETFQGPPAMVERLTDVSVRHKKEAIDVKSSMERNKQILIKHFNETGDPRDASYLGMTMMAEKNYKAAIQFFLKHIETSGSDEDKYRSWCRIADCEWINKNFEQALYATDEAIKIKPSFPDAYYIKVLNYTTLEEYDKGIEWLKVAMGKPIPDTLAMVDPTLYQFRGMAMGAMCFLFSGRVREAFQLYQAVVKESPDFYKNWSEADGIDWPSMYEAAYFDQKAIDYLKWLLHYIEGNGGKVTKLFEAIPPNLFADVRLNAERAKFLPTQTWPNKSIAIYCGRGNEVWGPDTLDVGMGGSEEAIVYLSRELAQQGWDVTVFNDRDEEYIDLVRIDQAGSITYKPWTLLNPNDIFDVFVAWRAPGLARTLNIKARKKVVDMHDVPAGVGSITNADVKANDLFMFKSNYHRSLAPNVPDDKAVVVGNGVSRSHFNA